MEAVRPAEAHDIERLVELLDQALDGERASGLRGTDLFRCDERETPTVQRLTGALGDAHAGVFVGTLDSHVVGLALVKQPAGPGAPVATVEELYVEPAAREVGLGELLLAATMDWAGGRGCVGIDIHVLPGDRRSKNLCERAGLTARSIAMHRRLAAD